MLDKEEVQALRDRNFVLDCDEITLTQLLSEKPRVLRGPGRFYQDSDGALQFLVYARDVPSPQFRHLPIGEIVPADEYFRLEATDLRGRHWSAERVDPKEDYSAPLRLSVARGKVASLHGSEAHEPRTQRRYAARGVIFAELKFPSNQPSVTERRRGRWQSTASAWDVAEFPVDEVSIHIHHDASEFVASAGC